MSEKRITEILEKSFDEELNGIDVNIQSQTSPFFQYFLLKELKTDILLTAPTIANEFTFSASSGHGFTGAINEMVTLYCGDKYHQSDVVSVNVNEITIALPFDQIFDIADTLVIRGSKNLALNGSVTPEKAYFRFYDSATIPVDISYIVITMVHSTVADDSLFGNITSLTNPIYFRKINGEPRNIGVFRNNQSFRNRGALVSYTDKAGGGSFATNVEFDLRKIYTKEIRLDPRIGDYVEFSNPSNLTGLTSLIISILGSFTRGE